MPTDISQVEFDRFATFVHKRFGIALTFNKKPLVINRLGKVLADRGFASFAEYMDHLEHGGDSGALSELVNRISTNHTFFYRELEHFEFFVKVALPETLEALRKRGSNDLRIWCAGCSSGEEAYMLVMLMFEHLSIGYSKWNAGVLATDISADVLRIAKKGVYAHDKLTHMPIQLRNKYFRKAGEGNWSVIELVKKELTFRRFNLVNEKFPFKKPFHMIFCRNVMIYFDAAARAVLTRKFYHLTEKGGYLFIGHSETLGRGDSPYKYLKPAVYKKP